MARDAEFVPLGVAKVGTVVVRMVLRPQPWRPFRDAAACKGDLVGLVDDFATGCNESDDLPVANRVRFLVVRLRDQEVRPRLRMGLPTGPRSLWLTEALVNSKDWHQLSIEPVPVSWTPRSTMSVIHGRPVRFIGRSSQVQERITLAGCVGKTRFHSQAAKRIQRGIIRRRVETT